MNNIVLKDKNGVYNTYNNISAINVYDDNGNLVKYSLGELSSLITKIATENGTYNATDDGADGYSTFTVAIPRAEGVAF